MVIGEFIEATNRLEKYYDKEYTQEQSRIMFEELQNLNITEYKRAIHTCLNTCKFLPKIADIKNALAEPKLVVENKQEIELVNCDKCRSGFIKYFKKINDVTYEFLALCNCENGKNQKIVNGYNFPFVNEIGL